MSSNPDLDLQTATLADLMAGLDGPDQPTRNSAETWLDTEGWFPGSTRVPGTELYPKYLTWHAENLDSGALLGVRAWGKVMSARFKKGRAATGHFYYISRETPAEVIAKLATE